AIKPAQAQAEQMRSTALELSKTYGLMPVGNGQAAAGLSAVFAEAEDVVAFLAEAFLAGAFLATGAAAFLGAAAAFLAGAAFFAAGAAAFFAGAAAAFLAGAAFLAAGAAAFFVAAAFTAAFLAGAATAFFAAAFLAGAAAAFLAATFLAGTASARLLRRCRLLGRSLFRSCHDTLLDQVAEQTRPARAVGPSSVQPAHCTGAPGGRMNGVAGRPGPPQAAGSLDNNRQTTGLPGPERSVPVSAGPQRSGRRGRQPLQSQLSAPPDWYSMTRVSKKLRSFFRSIISLIQGNGFSSFGKSGSRPICVARRLAM
ncbi:MAG: hypothetical protein RL223_2903, partial [Pseudomonadota bacterium]